VGNPVKEPMTEISKTHRNDFGELYPPILEKTNPPRIMPINGAVRQINAKT